MKRVISAVLFCFLTSANAFEFDIGVSGRESGVDGFYFSIGDHYRVPKSEVIAVERYIPRDDINVAFFLAKRAKRDVRFITKLRHEGKSWWDISLRLGLDPYSIYVVNTYNDYGPPYGKAYGYSKKEKRHRLNDTQIVELVNVRFLSDYHRISPDEVIERRRKESDFYRDRNEYREKRHAMEKHHKERYQKDREREYKKYDRRDERYRDDIEQDRKKGNGNGRGRD